MELREAGETDHTTREARRFRQNFRVPYPFFVHLVELVRDRDWFPTGELDATGRTAIPVELKVSKNTLDAKPVTTKYTKYIFQERSASQQHRRDSARCQRCTAFRVAPAVLCIPLPINSCHV